MSNYTKQISWSGKDALSDSDTEKVISGGDFDTEFSAVQTAINSKIDGGTITNFTSTGIDDNATSTAITIDSAEHVSLAHGIGFNGDTAAANALDDYEEGTWTVYEVNGQGGTVTTNRANYTKIGRMVYASASVTVGTTTNVNTLNFTLPFASTINGYYLGGGNVSYHQFPVAQSDNLRPTIENAAASVFFLYGDNSNADLKVKCNQASTKRIDFFVQYQVS